MKKIDDFFKIVERDGEIYLIPKRKINLGDPKHPMGKLALDGNTFEMFKTTGTNYECATLTYDSSLGDYVLKPEKGGTGALKNVTLTGDGVTRGVSVEPTVSAVGIGTAPDTSYAAKIGGNTSIGGQVAINPINTAPPLILGANAQGEMVTGLNAEMLGGKTIDELSGGALHLSVTNTVIQNTTTETTLWSDTLDGGILGTNKAVALYILFLPSPLTAGVNAGDLLKIYYGGQVITQTNSGFASVGRTWIECFIIYNGNSAQNTFTKMVSQATLSSATILGSGVPATVDSTVSQTVRVSIKPASTSHSYTLQLALLKIFGG